MLALLHAAGLAFMSEPRECYPTVPLMDGGCAVHFECVPSDITPATKWSGTGNFWGCGGNDGVEPSGSQCEKDRCEAWNYDPPNYGSNVCDEETIDMWGGAVGAAAEAGSSDAQACLDALDRAETWEPNVGEGYPWEWPQNECGCVFSVLNFASPEFAEKAETLDCVFPPGPGWVLGSSVRKCKMLYPEGTLPMDSSS